MQDEFDSGLGMPDEELTGVSPAPESGGPEAEVGGSPSAGHRESGGARARNRPGSKPAGAAKRPAKRAKKAKKAAKKKSSGTKRSKKKPARKASRKSGRKAGKKK